MNTVDFSPDSYRGEEWGLVELVNWLTAKRTAVFWVTRRFTEEPRSCAEFFDLGIARRSSLEGGFFTTELVFILHIQVLLFNPFRGWWGEKVGLFP